MASIATKFGLNGGSVPGTRGGLPNVGYKTGDYYAPILSGARTSAGTGTTNLVQVVPFVSRVAQSYDRIALENTGTSDNGKVIRLGVIADNGGTPIGGAVLANPAEITLDGTAKDNASTISISLTAGQLVWLSLSINSTVTMACIACGAGDVGWTGVVGNRLGALAVTEFPYFTVTYGALPDPFTSGVSVAGVVATNPYIRLRAA